MKKTKVETLFQSWFNSLITLRWNMWLPYIYIYIYIWIIGDLIKNARSYLCMYLCMYACMYVCMYVCIYACISVYLYSLKLEWSLFLVKKSWYEKKRTVQNKIENPFLKSEGTDPFIRIHHQSLVVVCSYWCTNRFWSLNLAFGRKLNIFGELYWRISG